MNSPRRMSFGRYIKRWKAWIRLINLKDKEPISPNAFYLINKLEAGGKWLASTSGVAIGLCMALLITAYGALIPNFGDCVAQRVTADAFGAGRILLVIFIISGVLGLLTAALPNIVFGYKPFTRFYKKDPTQKLEVNPQIRQGTAATIAYLQTWFLIASFLLLVLGLVASIQISSSQTPEALSDSHREISAKCKPAADV